MATAKSESKAKIVALPKQAPGKFPADLEKARRVGDSVRRVFHTAAISFALHVYNHGDWRGANQLVAAMGAGVRRSEMVNWLKTYTGMEQSPGAMQFTGWKGKEYIRGRFQEAKAHPWYENEAKRMQKQAENGEGDTAAFGDFNLSKAVLTLVSRGEEKKRLAREKGKAFLAEHVDVTLSDEAITALFNFANMGGDIVDLKAGNKVVHIETARKEKTEKPARKVTAKKTGTNGGKGEVNLH